ncbi:MAG: ester cyclase [Hyellaceae cyanobacterium CSU_1_1]|nr:ester cyclase [Hyellaceae cyanobacterium CSU_1_1]
MRETLTPPSTNFAAFSNIQIEILQQIAESDRVVTYMRSRGEHTGTFCEIPPTRKTISMSVIRIDLIQDGKIAEHYIGLFLTQEI